MEVNKYVNLDVNYRAFISVDALEFISALDVNQKPLWGMMTPQHMIEHLIYILENSSDKREMKLVIPEEKVEKSQAFLRSNRSLPVNFKFPLLPEDKLVDLKFINMGTAVSALEEEVTYFLIYIDSEKFTTVVHPFYGALNRDEILLFQYKHFVHHLRQFGMK